MYQKMTKPYVAKNETWPACINHRKLSLFLWASRFDFNSMSVMILGHTAPAHRGWNLATRFSAWAGDWRYIPLCLCLCRTLCCYNICQASSPSKNQVCNDNPTKLQEESYFTPPKMQLKMCMVRTIAMAQAQAEAGEIILWGLGRVMGLLHTRRVIQSSGLWPNLLTGSKYQKDVFWLLTTSQGTRSLKADIYAY